MSAASELIQNDPYINIKGEFEKYDRSGMNSEGCTFTAEMAYKFALVYKTSNTSQKLEPYIEEICLAALSVVPLYPRIFGDNFICTILKDDLTGNSTGTLELWRKECEETKTVEEFISAEIKLYGIEELRANKKSAVVKFLWMMRALNFLMKFLEAIISDKNESLLPAATHAYSLTLKPYHGFMISNLVKLAFQLCPTRQKLFSTLGFKDPDVGELVCKHLLELSKPIIGEINRILEYHHCNFCDKA